MDSDRAGMRGTIELPLWGTTTVLRKVGFSLCTAALAAKKEVNYCWWDSC